MSLLADALQPYFVRDLITISGRLDSSTLPDALIAPLAAFDLTFDHANESILADFREASPVVSALAADACRLSCASFQSISRAASDLVERDDMAWGIIKLYYSAFYAGNAIVRVLGESCSYFDARHVLKINQTAAALGRTPSFTISGGLYRCEMIQKDTTLRCTRIRGGSGGAHEAFWAVFGARLQTVSEGILKGPLIASEAQAVFARLEELRELLRRNSNYGWLSTMRNAVQYRQEHGVWYPKQFRTRDRETLSRRAGRWADDPMIVSLGPNSGTLGEFVGCCCFIASLCRSLLVRIAECSSVGSKSFVRHGPIAYLNDIAA